MWSRKLNPRKLNGRKYYFNVERFELEEFRVDVCVRGQHIYKNICYAVVSEVLVCKREPNNFQDR